MNTTELLEKAVSAGASDIFVVAGRPVSMDFPSVHTACRSDAPYLLLLQYLSIPHHWGISASSVIVCRVS